MTTTKIAEYKKALKGTIKEQQAAFNQASDMGTIKDDQNPIFMFNMTSTEVLLLIASGQIDPVAYAKLQLANRGLDKTGKWVGFEAAEKIHGIK